MNTTIGQTETDFYVKNRKATAKLLRALHQHHDFRMMLPVGLPAPKPEPEPIKHTPEFEELWFSIEQEITPVPEPKIEEIKMAVCRYFKITPTAITSLRREEETLRPRQIAIYLAKQLTGRSYPEIARRFGKRDHTTAISSVRRIEALCLSHWDVAHDVAHLERQFT